jgi:hypothetical protein
MPSKRYRAANGSSGHWLGHATFNRSIRSGSIPTGSTISRCRLKVSRLLWEQDQAGSIPVTSTNKGRPGGPISREGGATPRVER